MYYKGIIKFMCYYCFEYIKHKNEPERTLAQLSKTPTTDTTHDTTHDKAYDKTFTQTHDPSSIDSVVECQV